MRQVGEKARQERLKELRKECAQKNEPERTKRLREQAERKLEREAKQAGKKAETAEFDRYKAERNLREQRPTTPTAKSPRAASTKPPKEPQLKTPAKRASKTTAKTPTETPTKTPAEPVVSGQKTEPPVKTPAKVPAEPTAELVAPKPAASVAPSPAQKTPTVPSAPEPVVADAAAPSAAVENKMPIAGKGGIGPMEVVSGGVGLGFDIIAAHQIAQSLARQQYHWGYTTFDDNLGTFIIHETDNGLWAALHGDGWTYTKEYLSGGVAGRTFEISKKQYFELKDESDKKHGYINFWGNFVPGEVPLGSREHLYVPPGDDAV